jgi:hypothetical protein
MHTEQWEFARRRDVLSCSAVFMGPGFFAARKAGMTPVA